MLNSQLELEEEEKPPKPISVNTLFNALHMCLAASLESPYEYLSENTEIEFDSFDESSDLLCAHSADAIYMCFKGIDYYEFGENKTQKLGNSYKRQYGGKIEANYYYRAQSARLYDSYRHAKRRRKRLIMCGHSDGGSCSIIATLMILFSNYFKLNSVDIICITFGAPYCVNKKIAKLCEELNFHHKFINFFNECLFIPVFHGSDDFYLTSTGGVITYYPRFLSDLNNLYEEMKSKHNNNNNKSNHHSHHHHYHSNNNKHSNKTIKKIKCPNKSILSASVEVINNKFVPLGKIYLCRGGRNHFLQEYILSIYAYKENSAEIIDYSDFEDSLPSINEISYMFRTSL